MKISKLVGFEYIKANKDKPHFKQTYDNRWTGATSAVLLSLIADAMGHPGTEFTKYFPEARGELVKYYEGMLYDIIHRLEFKHFKVTRPDSKTIAITYDIFYTEAELRDAGVIDPPNEDDLEDMQDAIK